MCEENRKTHTHTHTRETNRDNYIWKIPNQIFSMFVSFNRPNDKSRSVDN